MSCRPQPRRCAANVFAWLALALFVGAVPAPKPVADPAKAQKQKAAIDAFFKGPILTIAIEMTPEEMARLKGDERHYAEATVTEGGKVQKSVAIKLKGSAGSFQGVDQKPGITLNFEKIKGGERWHGVKKLHLNNCAQDGSYLNELIAGEIARRAGVPASRCNHAFVSLNGRDLGLYVVKEAFTRDFLAPFYPSTKGDLYDGGFCREIDEKMEKDLGDEGDTTGLKELMTACAEPDPIARWQRLGKVLDLDKFLSFMALEDLLCHWDGYNFNRNNYRLYRDPATGRFSFFLHGMDQMFGDANFPLIRDFGSMVGGAVMRTPGVRKLYVARLEKIYTTVLKPIDWPARAVAEGKKLTAAIAEKNPQWAKDFQGQIDGERDRITARIAAVGKQLAAIPPPVVFDKNGELALLKGWRSEGPGAVIDEANLQGTTALHIRATGETTASIRKNLELEPGRYRFEGNVRTLAVVPTPSEAGEGAGLRISGASRDKLNSAVGDTPWRKLSYDFETPGGEVILIAELRATRGNAWFHTQSLKLVRVK